LTHSLHRRGERESLEGDYIVFVAREKPIEDPERNQKLIHIMTRHNPMGVITQKIIDGKRTRPRYAKWWEKSMDSGLFESATLEEINVIELPRSWGAVYSEKEDVQNVVKELAEAELGYSVVVSGIFDEVRDICVKAGTQPHTVNMSLETHGNTSLIAEPKILEFVTMCGHSFIAPSLVKYLIERVKKGAMTAEAAAVEMGKQCTCNFFNNFRAVKMINEYINNE
jgi:hypothetical protein